MRFDIGGAMLDLEVHHTFDGIINGISLGALLAAVALALVYWVLA